jgi:hypothetical protein
MSAAEDGYTYLFLDFGPSSQRDKDKARGDELDADADDTDDGLDDSE